MATYIQSYFSPPQPFEEDDIHLTIEATSPLVSLSLTFGEGSYVLLDNTDWFHWWDSPGYSLDPWLYYPYSGEYTITLDGTFENNDTFTEVKQITILDATTGIYTGTVYSDFFINEPVSFYVDTYGDSTAVSWLWDFGDGTTSTEQNPIHTYTTLGEKTVTTTVTLADGTSRSKRNTYIVFENNYIIDFDVSSTITQLGTTVFFTAKPDMFVGISDYYWDFGDGIISTEQNPVHTYTLENTGGANKVYASLSIRYGGLPFVRALSKEITIEASGVRPEASFEINIPHLSSAYIWEDICCKYTAAHGNPVICEWHFIEESVPESYAFGTHIHHFFRTVGLHQIQLTVTDTVTGISSIITRNVEVQAGIVDFMHSVSQQETEWGDPLPSTAYVDVPTQFINTSTIEGISWLWDFGDGTISTEFCPLHTFDTVAIYEVTLTITLKNSETLSIIKSVEISSFPTLPPFAKTLYEANNAEGIIVFNVQDNYTGVVDITEYPNGTISLNREYYKQAEASGGTLDYTFSVVSGSLPPGVVFNENDGTFEGIPTEEGVYTFELFVIDQQFRTDTQTCVLTVIPFTYDPLVIWTEYLTHGQTCLNKSYSEYILITGGVLPYSFSIDNGVLPYGMYINENLAQITGTAKKEGIYSFDFSVIDSIGLIKTKRYTIEVVDCGDDFTSRLFPSYMSETVTVKDNFHQKYLYDYLPLSIKEFKDS